MEGIAAPPIFLKKQTYDTSYMPSSPFRRDQNVVDNEPKCFIMLFNNCINAMEITTVTRIDKRGILNYGFNS
jgi:hypothetical protein